MSEMDSDIYFDIERKAIEWNMSKHEVREIISESFEECNYE